MSLDFDQISRTHRSREVSEDEDSPKALGAHDIQLQLLLPSEEIDEEDMRNNDSRQQSDPELIIPHRPHANSLEEEEKKAQRPESATEPRLRLMNLFDVRGTQENSNASILVVDDNSYNMISIMTVL